VTGAQQRRIASAFDIQARQWWSSVVAEPHAFTKPVFQIGLGGWKASNVEASGAIEMSRGDVLLASFANFSNTGHVCWNVNVSDLRMNKGWDGLWHWLLTTARCMDCAPQCIVLDKGR
jgi:hypothetical protein